MQHITMDMTKIIMCVLSVNTTHLVVSVTLTAACNLSQDSDSVGVGSDGSSIMHNDVTCERVGVGK